jgi:hypothetical protein
MKKLKHLQLFENFKIDEDPKIPTTGTPPSEEFPNEQ